MIMFNWSYLYKYCKKDCNTIIDVLRYLSGIDEITNKTADIVNKIKDEPKDSYVLDCVGLLTDTTATNQEKCIYIYIASKRNYLDYKMANKDWLNLNLISVDIDKIKYNRLLSIKNDIIYFKY